MSNFEYLLEKNINERQSALFEIERMIFTKRYNLSKKHREILSIQSISMIYSIWEGFIQTSFNLFIDEINSRDIEPHLIEENLFVYHVESTFKQLKDYPEKHSRKVAFLYKLKEFFNNNRFKLNNGIRTQNNVSFEILNAILKSFCLEPFPEQWNYYSYPNSNLKEMLTSFLKYRNSVAHGGDISSEEKVTQDVFFKYKKLILDLMYEMQLKMIESANNQMYIKRTNTNHII